MNERAEDIGVADYADAAGFQEADVPERIDRRVGVEGIDAVVLGGDVEDVVGAFAGDGDMRDVERLGVDVAVHLQREPLAELGGTDSRRRERGFVEIGAGAGVVPLRCGELSENREEGEPVHHRLDSGELRGVPDQDAEEVGGAPVLYRRPLARSTPIAVATAAGKFRRCRRSPPPPRPLTAAPRRGLRPEPGSTDPPTPGRGGSGTCGRVLSAEPIASALRGKKCLPIFADIVPLLSIRSRINAPKKRE